MAVDLVARVHQALNAGVVDQLGKLTGEPTAKTQSVVGAAVPAVLGGIIQHGASSQVQLEQLTSMIGKGTFDGLPALLGGGAAGVEKLLASGRKVLDVVFANRLDYVVASVARAAGVGGATTRTVLAAVAPFAMAAIGSEAGSGASPSSILGVLLSGKDGVAKQVPAGFGPALGLKSAADLGTGAIPASRIPNGGAVAILAAAAIVGLFGYRSCMSHRMGSPVTGPRMATVTLPSGITFQVEEDTFLFDLSRYLANAQDTSVPKTFVFDNLNFDVGTTTLTPPSYETVTHLTHVLVAYPAVAVMLVGYADSTGDAAANKVLSLNRAKAISGMLASGGVAPDRMVADGRGEENPIASNATEEGRAKNRRLELVVTKK